VCWANRSANIGVIQATVQVQVDATELLDHEAEQIVLVEPLDPVAEGELVEDLAGVG